MFGKAVPGKNHQSCQIAVQAEARRCLLDGRENAEGIAGNSASSGRYSVLVFSK